MFNSFMYRISYIERAYTLSSTRTIHTYKHTYSIYAVMCKRRQCRSSANAFVFSSIFFFFFCFFQLTTQLRTGIQHFWISRWKLVEKIYYVMLGGEHLVWRGYIMYICCFCIWYAVWIVLYTHTYIIIWFVQSRLRLTI